MSVFFHRYAFIFHKGYFLISKTLGNDYTEETLDNEMVMVNQIFVDEAHSDA
jgi:hypothetical protein